MSSSSTVLLQSVDIAIPGYKILRPIGEGGMASVFLAMQESLDREVALKVMAPALAANSEFTERFLKEGRITAKLQHQNLVTVYDIGTHAGVYYLAAEYIPGGTLKERIAEGALSIGEILDIMVEMARGLDFAHQKGFVHRDVKPGNILFRKDGSAVLADFGIAKAMDSSSSSTVAGASIGTPDYMSPEQARAEPVDGRSDLYSLGTVLYEMLTGAPPYQAADPFTVALMHVTQPVPQLPAEYAWLQPLVNRTMAKNPAERVQTGALLAEEVHQLLTSAPEGAAALGKMASKGQARISATQSGRGATAQRTRIVNREAGLPGWLWPAVGAVVVLVGVGIWYLTRSPPLAQVIPNTPVAPVTMGSPAGSGMADGSSGALDSGVHNPLTIEQQYGGDVQQMLEQADAFKNHGTTSKADIGRNLVMPDGANAAELYRKVLSIQSDNKRAQQGLQDIAAFYVAFAQRACDAQLYDACKLNAENGMLAEPNDPKLQALHKLADDQSRGISSGSP
ncbi:MAG: serine/threonine protein kinase [Proteobacteria bacterium]|nr:serine/threonine protein kinase [Pseudomonadota bacterium]